MIAWAGRVSIVVAIGMWLILWTLRVFGGWTFDMVGPAYALPADLFVLGIVVHYLAEHLRRGGRTKGNAA